MMVWTNENTVVRAGIASVYPVDHVMCVAPARRASTAREGTTLVPYHEGPADRPGDQAPFPTDVEGLARCVDHDGENFGVTGQLPHRLRGDLRAVVQQARATLRADTFGQLVVVDGHHDLRPIPTVLGQRTTRVHELAHLDQGVGHALPRGAR